MNRTEMNSLGSFNNHSSWDEGGSNFKRKLYQKMGVDVSDVHYSLEQEEEHSRANTRPYGGQDFSGRRSLIDNNGPADGGFSGSSGFGRGGGMSQRSSSSGFGNFREMGTGNSRETGFGNSMNMGLGNSREMALMNSMEMALKNSRQMAFMMSREMAFMNSREMGFGNSRETGFGNSREMGTGQNNDHGGQGGGYNDRYSGQEDGYEGEASGNHRHQTGGQFWNKMRGNSYNAGRRRF